MSSSNVVTCSGNVVVLRISLYITARLGIYLKNGLAFKANNGCPYIWVLIRRFLHVFSIDSISGKRSIISKSSIYFFFLLLPFPFLFGDLLLSFPVLLSDLPVFCGEEYVVSLIAIERVLLLRRLSCCWIFCAAATLMGFVFTTFGVLDVLLSN